MKQQQAVQYLAFHVHQATIVANCRDAEGKVVMPVTVAAEASAILQFVKSCGPRVDVAFLGDAHRLRSVRHWRKCDHHRVDLSMASVL